jgi:hypothetical protein
MAGYLEAITKADRTNLGSTTSMSTSTSLNSMRSLPDQPPQKIGYPNQQQLQKESMGEHKQHGASNKGGVMSLSLFEILEAQDEDSHLEETSCGEFAFVEVTPDDFTVCHDMTTKMHLPEPRQHEVQHPAPLQHAATFHVSSDPASRHDDAKDAETPSSVTVRNTFIHIGPSTEPEATVGWSSCPGVVMSTEFHTKYPAMEKNHILDVCRPCAYFLIKKDGCRAGDQCNWCHLCPVAAIKRKKKEKVRALKERDRLASERGA